MGEDPDDPAIWNKAVERIRELGRHAEELDIELSLEMYEDTYLGTADSSVRFVEEVGLDNVGINADLGNLIRLHRPVEHWQQMMEKVAPYAKVLARQELHPYRRSSLRCHRHTSCSPRKRDHQLSCSDQNGAGSRICQPVFM